MRTVILGAGGQLATDLERVLADSDVVALARAELDICDPESVGRVLAKQQPDVVINTAAFHEVDNCEDQWERAFSVNAFAPRKLAGVCLELHATLVHISTDYVFSGAQSTPYIESDLPDPLSAYGASKAAGEFFVRTYSPDHIIVRSSGLYGVAGASRKSGNFVETMVRLASSGKPLRVVDDQIMAPTNTSDLAKKIIEVIEAGARGTFHITNQGACSWYEYARQIFEFLGLEPDFGPTTTKAFGARAARPAYSVLANGKLESMGIAPPGQWQDALRRYLVDTGRV